MPFDQLISILDPPSIHVANCFIDSLLSIRGSIVESNEFLVRSLAILTTNQIIDESTGITLMHCAATMSDGLIKSLLEREHHINSMTNNGHSPLCYTLKAKRWDLVDTMLNNGATVYSRPVYYAIDNDAPSHILFKILKSVDNYKDLLVNKNETSIISLMIEKDIINEDISRIPTIRLMIQHLALDVLPMILKANSVELLQYYLQSNASLSSSTMIDLLENGTEIDDKVLEIFINALPSTDALFSAHLSNNICKILIIKNNISLTKKLIALPHILDIFTDSRYISLDYTIQLGRVEFAQYLIDNNLSLTVGDHCIRHIDKIVNIDQDFLCNLYCRCLMNDAVIYQLSQLILDKYKCAIRLVSTPKLTHKLTLRKLNYLGPNYNYVDSNGKTLDNYCINLHTAETIKSLRKDN